MLVYVGSCVFTFSLAPRIGTVAPRNPPVAPSRGTSDGNMRTLCTGNPGKSSQPQEKQSPPAKTGSTDRVAPRPPSVGSPA